MSATDTLEKQAQTLYLTFCLPKIIVNIVTGKNEVIYEWVDENARALFDHIQSDILAHRVIEETRKQEYKETA